MYEYLGHVQGGVQDKHLLAPRATKHDHQRQHGPGMSWPRGDPTGAFKPKAPLREIVKHDETKCIKYSCKFYTVLTGYTQRVFVVSKYSS